MLYLQKNLVSGNNFWLSICPFSQNQIPAILFLYLSLSSVTQQHISNPKARGTFKLQYSLSLSLEQLTGYLQNLFFSHSQIYLFFHSKHVSHCFSSCVSHLSCLQISPTLFPNEHQTVNFQAPVFWNFLVFDITSLEPIRPFRKNNGFLS